MNICLMSVEWQAGMLITILTNFLDSKSKAAPFAKKLLLFHAETQVISKFAVLEYYHGNLYFLVLEKATEQILIRKNHRRRNRPDYSL